MNFTKPFPIINGILHGIYTEILSWQIMGFLNKKKEFCWCTMDICDWIIFYFSSSFTLQQR